jgi:DNA adenine methylase
MKSPLKFVGSKRTLCSKIVSLFPLHQCYVEPFFGGGSVFFYKKPSSTEVINDNDQLLITFFRVIRDDLDSFLKKFEYALSSRDLFMEYRESKWSELDDVEKAFRVYYIIKNSYGGLFRFNKEGKCNSPFSSNADRKARNSLFSGLKLVKRAHIRLQNTIIENLDYLEILKRFDRKDTLFFLDPPYDSTYAYGKTFDHDVLLEACRKVQGKFILTLNTGLKDLFSEFSIIQVMVQDISTKPREDIIILNYEAKRRQKHLDALLSEI